MDLQLNLLSRVKTSCMAFTSWIMTMTASESVVSFLDVLLFEGLHHSPSVSMVVHGTENYVMCCS